MVARIFMAKAFQITNLRSSERAKSNRVVWNNTMTWAAGLCKQSFFVITMFVVAAAVPVLAQNAPLPTPVRTWSSPGHTRYYVDSVAGSDTNDGKSPGHPWQNLDKVNTGIFAAGDWIYLKSGSHWDTYFAPGGSGAKHHPVKVTSYGKGPLPSIDAHGKTLATLSLQNQEYWDVENLDVTNTSTEVIPWLRCIEVSLLDFGTAHGIVLKKLYIHDLSGPEDKGHGGSGIFIDNRGDKVRSRFDGLLIRDCHLVYTDRNGITMDSGYDKRNNWYPNLHVVIRHNLLENIGGDCICAIGCDGVLIERNTVHGGRERASDWASGIWVWSCDNSVIQYNECSGMHGQMDAQGFDADYNTRNTLIQYNYSHDNEGGFVMMCTPGGPKPPEMIGNDHTTIRYNISQNDQFRTFTLSGPVTNARIYDNSVYIGPTDHPILLFAWNWGGKWPDEDTFLNNIFYADRSAEDAMGSSTNITIGNNVFYGKFNNLPQTSNTQTADPLLKSPGSGTDGISSLDGYKLQKQSPCKSGGVIVPDNGGRDFFDKRVPSNRPPTMGASQN
jgi:hypothetical protein